MIERVFLDMDGVLADFTSGMHKAIGVDYDPLAPWPYRFGPEGWDWNKEIGWPFEDMSRLCDYNFWEQLPWTRDGRGILRIVLSHVDIDRITLLSTPMPNPMSESGKVAWIKKNLPEYLKRMVLCREKKSILAKIPGAVLIDDNDSNIEQWEDAGGYGILVPRPWNSFYECDTLSTVSNLLRTFNCLMGDRA